MSAEEGTTPMQKLDRPFYNRPAVEVAPDLIGKTLVHVVGRKTLRARITETEAYVGEHDLACHAAKGRTPRTEVMFGPPGHAYVYFIYGIHEMFNIVTAPEGDAQAVLIRAAEPLDGWDANLTGPGNLARHMKITRADYARDLTGDRLHLLDDGRRPAVLATTRVGVDYSGEWRDAPLRFYDAASLAVSKRPRSPAKPSS